ncbi:hypothetical protein SERLA73DRAFT_76958 [Serpula lacrymans var. lacrymans S7.3]|uniref:Uncharacterized protein n=1 Tax=Serpula lacrymans var. lacrymans (strain S7.3) TaxID=936435 RepID=F8Q8M7_SERL3|nr:hypothetical protein SERLA73DRAFT_76958 [Serpula lacrymans var. lacrymans S7.3]
MSYEYAEAWAQKKFPDFTFGSPSTLAETIRKRLNKDLFKIPWTLAVRYQNQDMILIVMSHRNTRLSPYTRKKFTEDDRVKLIKHSLFGGMEGELEFLKDLEFVTIPDPYTTGLP